MFYFKNRCIPKVQNSTHMLYLKFKHKLNCPGCAPVSQWLCKSKLFGWYLINNFENSRTFISFSYGSCMCVCVVDLGLLAVIGMPLLLWFRISLYYTSSLCFSVSVLVYFAVFCGQCVCLFVWLLIFVYIRNDHFTGILTLHWLSYLRYCIAKYLYCVIFEN